MGTDEPTRRDLKPGVPGSDDLLADWALGQLEGPQRARVEGELARSADLRRRVEPLRRTLAVLDRWPTEPPPDDLADLVCERVAEERSRPARRVVRPSIFSLTEIGAVAAALLLLALVFVPPAYRARFAYQQKLCQDNMRRIGVAMEHYANEHANALPFMALPAGDNWLKREGGRRPTGTAPLFILVRQRKVQPGELVCPATKDLPFAGEPGGLVDFPDPVNCSYSFQNLFGAAGPIVRDSARVVPVLADRNPLFADGRPAGLASGGGNSCNHGSRGQNVLYNDGRVLWRETPHVGINNDNIWLIGAIRAYTGTEVSADRDDSFLAP